MSRPRIYCDFNKRYDRLTYGLNTVGTAADVARLGLRLTPALEVTLYDHDTLEDGSPAWLLAEGVVVELPGGALAAKVDDATFRWEPRAEEGGEELGARTAV